MCSYKSVGGKEPVNCMLSLGVVGTSRQRSFPDPVANAALRTVRLDADNVSAGAVLSSFSTNDTFLCRARGSKLVESHR